jgi:hypothetical protein
MPGPLSRKIKKINYETTEDTEIFSVFSKRIKRPGQKSWVIDSFQWRETGRWDKTANQLEGSEREERAIILND